MLHTNSWCLILFPGPFDPSEVTCLGKSRDLLGIGVGMGYWSTHPGCVWLRRNHSQETGCLRVCQQIQYHAYKEEGARSLPHAILRSTWNPSGPDALEGYYLKDQ